jgi:hypothetical protein
MEFVITFRRHVHLSKGNRYLILDDLNAGIFLMLHQCLYEVSKLKLAEGQILFPISYIHYTYAA